MHTTSFLQNKFRQTFALKGDIKIILFVEKIKLKFKNEVFIFLLHFSTYNIKKLLLQIKFYPRYKNFEYSILSWILSSWTEYKFRRTYTSRIKFILLCQKFSWTYSGDNVRSKWSRLNASYGKKNTNNCFAQRKQTWKLFSEHWPYSKKYSL